MGDFVYVVVLATAGLWGFLLLLASAEAIVKGAHRVFRWLGL
jgi:hypothetical protein